MRFLRSFILFAHTEKAKKTHDCLFDKKVYYNSFLLRGDITPSNHVCILYPLINFVSLSAGTALDELSLGDPFDGSKSRKSSGFSSSGGTSADGGSKSRQQSGYDMGNKSRNCSGNSISASLVSSGILNGSAPVMIPSSTASGSVTTHSGGGQNTGTSPKGGSPMQISNGIISGSDNSGENVSIFDVFEDTHLSTAPTPITEALE